MTATDRPNIVIVTYNWPPRNAIGAHRPYSWAKHWSQAGARVTVLTAKKYPFDAPLDLRLPELAGVEVIEVPFLKIPVAIPGFLGGEKIRRFAKMLLGKLRKPGREQYDIRMGWRTAANARAEQLARSSDVVVSTYGPAASHLIGADMKAANPELVWIADYRDLWSQNPTIPYIDARDLELASVGAGADAIMTISDRCAGQLRELHSQDILVLENGFDIGRDKVLANLARIRPGRSGPVRIVHTGMLYPGLRDPEPLLRAIVALATDGEISPGDLTLDFYGARIEGAEDLARNPTYAPFIRIMGHVPREQALAAQLDADRLLLLESPDPRSRSALTGKIFEYIASGTPVLSVGSPEGTAIFDFIAKTGAGICCGTDEDAMKREVLQLVKNRGRPAWYKPKAEEILKYSRERQAGTALDFIRQRLIRRQGNSDS